MEMHLIRGLAVDFPFRDCDAVKNRNRFLFHPVTQRTARDQITNLAERAAMMMFVFMFMVVVVPMLVFVLVVMMIVLMLIFMVVVMAMIAMFMMVVIMMTVRAMLVFIFIMVVMMGMVMLILVVTMAVFMMVIIVLEMHIELRAFDPGLLSACEMKMIAVELESFQFMFKLGEFNAQIEQRAEEHVAADSTEDIEIKRFHSSSPAASALIWLAA